MKIDITTAVSLVAVIRTDLEAVDQLESHVNQLNLALVLMPLCARHRYKRSRQFAQRTV